MKLVSYDVKVKRDFEDDPGEPDVLGGRVPSKKFTTVNGFIQYKLDPEDVANWDGWDDFWVNQGSDTAQKEVQEREGITVTPKLTQQRDRPFRSGAVFHVAVDTTDQVEEQAKALVDRLLEANTEGTSLDVPEFAVHLESMLKAGGYRIIESNDQMPHQRKPGQSMRWRLELESTTTRDRFELVVNKLASIGRA